MGKLKKESFIQSLSHFISDECEQESALKLVAEILSGGNRPKKLRIEDVEMIERVASALIRCGRLAGLDANQFQLRDLTAKEGKLLEAAKKSLNLRGRWEDHMVAVDSTDGSCFVGEPYGLKAIDFEDIKKLIDSGWKVEVDQRLGSHFPSKATVVKLVPPK